MGAVLVVFGDPRIKVGLQLVDRAIDPFAEGNPVELIQDSAMEALADAICLRALGLGAAVIDVLDGKSAMNEVSGLCLLQDRRQLRGLEASMWPVCQHADRIRPARGPRAKPSPAIPCLNGDGCC